MRHRFENGNHFLGKTKLGLGALTLAGISLMTPNAAHATDAAPASPSVTVPPSVEAAATASPSPSPTVLAKPSTFPSPSVSAEASPSLSPSLSASSTPLPQPSKIKITIDDSGLYPTGPKPTDLGFIGLPGVPLEPGPAHPAHGQTHHTDGPQHFVKPNQLPATGLPTDELLLFGAASLATGIALAGLKRPK